MNRRPSRVNSLLCALAGAVLAASCTSSTSGTTNSSSNGSTSTSPDAPPSTTTSAGPTAGRPFTFTRVQLDLVDTTRAAGTKGTATYSAQRDLPTDLYLPTVSSSGAPRPLIMFSHGNKGNPNKFTELFEHWAAAGYIVAAPRFPRTSNVDPYEFVDYPLQPGDISFVLTELLKGEHSEAIDTNRIAAAGLSLGGGTTYALTYNPCCIDTRFRAAAVFDGLRFQFDKPFGVNKVPVLIMHIDPDAVLPYSTAVDSYNASASPKFLVTLLTGLHAEPFEDTPSIHDKTTMKVTTDFFDLTLLDDTAARERLLADGNVPKEATTIAG